MAVSYCWLCFSGTTFADTLVIGVQKQEGGAKALKSSVEKHQLCSDSETCKEKFNLNAWHIFEHEWKPQQVSSTGDSSGSSLCLGWYQEPDRPGLSDNRDPNTLPLSAEADRAIYQKNGESLFSGEVVLRQGNRQLQTQALQFSKAQDKATISSPFKLREPGILIAGEQGEYFVKDGAATASNAVYLMHDRPMRGVAKELARSSDGAIDLFNATYTSCPHNANFWSIKGTSFHLDPVKGYGSADGATLRILDVPIFYAPRFYFPIDDKRHSGFLYPTVSHDSDNGLNISQPYYINLAPNYDMTLTPRVMTNRGLLLENEFRYMTKHQTGELGAAFLGNDGKRDENRNYKENRWLINWRHNHQVTDYFNYSINYADASDKDYLDDFGTELNVGSQSPLWQQLQMQLHNRTDVANHQWQLNARFQQAKSMLIDADDPYQREPQFTLNGEWKLGGGFTWNYFADYNYFNRNEDWQYKRKYWVDQANDVEDSIFGPGSASSISNAIGERFWAQTGLKYRLSNDWSFIEPSISYRYLNYHLDRLGDPYVDNAMAANAALSRSDVLSPSAEAPLYAIDSGLFFERKALFGKSSFTQTLEPRFKYVYSPYRNDQYLQPSFDSGYAAFSYNTLWRDTRFGGYDRIGDTHHLAVGLTSRFLEENGFERFRIGVGQIVYFQDRKVMIDPMLTDETNPDYNLSQEQERLLNENRAKTSPLATQLTWFINNKMRINQDWMFDTQEGKVDEYALSFRYRPNQESLAQARYHYRDQVDRFKKDELGNNTGILTSGNLEEVSGSFILPMGGRWRTFGRWTYDITNNRDMERIIGLTRKSCCHRMQLAYKIWRDPTEPVETAEQKKGIFFELELSGLGSLTGRQVGGFVDAIKRMSY